MTDTIKIRVTAREDVCRKFAVIIFGVKLAVAFGRDSGAKVGYNARMISGKIGSGGSMKNWFCYADEGTVFELEVDRELYNKNKNRIKKWDIEVLDDFSISKERADMINYVENNLE